MFAIIKRVVAQLAPSPTPLSTAVDALVAEPLDGLSDGALGSDIIDIRREIDRLEGECLRRLHRFDRSHGALAEGAVSTVSWLRASCGVTGAVAAQRVGMARMLADLPTRERQPVCGARLLHQHRAHRQAG